MTFRKIWKWIDFRFWYITPAIVVGSNAGGYRNGGYIFILWLKLQAGFHYRRKKPKIDYKGSIPYQ